MTQPTFPSFPITAPDLVASPDMTALALETSSEAQNLTQDLLHTLMALPGSNLDLPLDRGVGVMRYLNGTSLASLKVAIEQDFEKDFRVNSCSATIVTNPPGSKFPYTIKVEADTVAGVLGLYFGWSQTGIQVIPSS